MKLIQKAGLLVLILIFISSILLISATFLLQDEVPGIVLKSLNKNILTKLEAGSVRLSFIRRFPRASVEMKDVLVHASSGFNKESFDGISTDTLLFSKSVSLEFRITDIIKGNYTIDKISAKEGSVNILTDSAGIINYEISRGSDTAGKSALAVDLQSISLNNINVLYYNLSTKLKAEGLVRTGKLKSRITGGNIDFIATAGIRLDTFRLNNTKLRKPADTTLDLVMNSSEDGLHFEKGVLGIDNNDFRLNGSILKGNRLDLNITGEKIDLARIREYLPEEYTLKTSGYSPSGTLSLNCRINGQFTAAKNPHIEIDCHLDNGKITSDKSVMSIRNITFNGHFSNGLKNNAASSVASFDDIDIRIGNSIFRGSLKIKGFPEPVSDIILSGQAYPEDIKKFFNIQKIPSAGGFADFDLKLRTNYRLTDTITLDYVLDQNPEVSLVFHSLTIGYDKWLFTNVDGNLLIEEKNYKPEKLLFEYEDQKIEVTGDFDDFPRWLAGKDVTLKAKADVAFDRFIPEAFFKENSESADDGVDFPNALLDLNLRIDNFKYKTFSASGIKSSINYRPNILIFKSLDMKTMEGFISGNGFISQNKNKTIISKGDFNISDIDIRKTFIAFNNFGQDFILAENLSGFLSGDVSALIPMNSSFKPDIKALTAEGKYVISDGSLINFGPVEQLSSFIELSELKNISFQKLANDFFIRSNVLYIPQMDVRSTAADLTISGQHGFDNNYQYHVKMLLSQLLSKKRKKKSSVSEFGVVQDDGLGRTSILLKVENKGEDVKVGYDIKAVGATVKNNIRSERKELKTILNEEYGWYRNEIPVKEKTEEKKSRFSVTWDETDSTNSVSDQVKVDRKSKSIFRKE